MRSCQPAVHKDAAVVIHRAKMQQKVMSPHSLWKLNRTAVIHAVVKAAFLYAGKPRFTGKRDSNDTVKHRRIN